MKQLLISLAGFAAMSLATAAYADDVTGTIKAINVVNQTVTLDDGKVYVFTANVDLKKVNVGDKVKVTYLPATPITQSSLGIFGSANALAPAG
jgi:hypothetical protein